MTAPIIISMIVGILAIITAISTAIISILKLVNKSENALIKINTALDGIVERIEKIEEVLPKISKNEKDISDLHKDTVHEFELIKKDCINNHKGAI